MHNWHVFNASKIIRLQHISIDHTGARHCALWVTTYDGNKFRLADGDYAADRSATWNGSMILRNITSIGATVYGVVDTDVNWLRIIWEEIE